ncbi:hypothetical protein CFB50_08605 [Burkholderia sp. AU33423]|uniref:RelA/SpoT domain-containing protein n=1 Tax=Burkholderia sp. AU33423 TaxID=2015355 RepID=UPI000B79D74E|nr:hypothetical protein [Burkholderia sp. AU33423]OXI88549.1 hypothetical protein CFB50_08605 [Burkholderia sp. AU33423]
MYQKTESEFRQQNNIPDGQWEVAKIDWKTLLAIGRHHESQKNSLTRAVEAMARDLQSIDLVHSVRFRIKDTDHLLAKIIRKRVEGSEKYADISVENYQTKITDLVGVRALHLFKEDLFRINQSILETWELEETPPVAYVRDGDQKEKLEEAGFDVQSRTAHYRSVHYIISTSPRRKKILAELQVRTIFEEGWAEIDHTVKYPAYSNDESIAEFLGIFNRLAGAADEMGSFVRRMAETVREVSAITGRKESASQNGVKQLSEPENLADNLDKYAVYLSFIKNKSFNPHRRTTKGMGATFKISDPIDKTSGDFLSFKISDSDREIPGRISRTALTTLGAKNASDLDIFYANKERIRTAAFNMLRRNPSLDIIALGSNNFLPQGPTFN